MDRRGVLQSETNTKENHHKVAFTDSATVTAPLPHRIVTQQSRRRRVETSISKYSGPSCLGHGLAIILWSPRRWSGGIKERRTRMLWAERREAVGRPESILPRRYLRFLGKSSWLLCVYPVKLAAHCSCHFDYLGGAALSARRFAVPDRDKDIAVI